MEILEKLKQRELVNTECSIIKGALSFFKKLVVSVIIWSSRGRQFHSAGPQKEKTRSPSFVCSLGFR